MLKDIKQYIYVIKELTTREIKRKYARSFLGMIWSVLNPLLSMLVVSAVFSYMFRRDIENFPIYYLCGTTIWGLFNEATRSSMTVLVDNKNFLIKTKLPKFVYVLSRSYTALVNYLFSLIAFALVLAVFNFVPEWEWLMFFFVLFMVTLFSIGIGSVLSILYVFFADIKHLYGVFLTLLMYLSAIFYPVDRLPPIMKQVLNFNPIYMFIYILRKAIMENEIAEPGIIIRISVVSISTFIIGLIVFNRKQNDVMIHI